ncbi:hypothetical protein Fmac_024876 [Flemingia macrophylla]|uniref:Uncharacterized protein n=1 Tax=Flemingia macrophylla TaxID=520843 RepID=A0ABD1LR86_9FABA
MSILSLMLQTSIAGHHSSRGQTLDREDGFQLLAVSVQEMMALSFGNLVTQLTVNQKPAYVARVEGKLDTLMNLVTQLAVNQKAASVARVCGIHSSNDHHTNVCSSSQQPRVNEHPEAYAANTYSRPP